MKTHLNSPTQPLSPSGLHDGIQAARHLLASLGASRSQAPDRLSWHRRSYPPPLYRRDEDLYVIGEHVPPTSGHRYPESPDSLRPHAGFRR